MTNAYAVALQEVAKATQIYREAQKAYLAKQIETNEFLVYRGAFYEAEAKFDLAFSLEQTRTPECADACQYAEETGATGYACNKHCLLSF